MLKISYKTGVILLGLVLSISAFAAPEGHFDPKGKAPSEHTIAVIEEARASLPFADYGDAEINNGSPNWGTVSGKYSTNRIIFFGVNVGW
jgi:hypothetical protein